MYDIVIYGLKVIGGIKAMIIKIADYTDLEEILELQQLAFQKEASEYNDYAIEPLTQTIDDLKEDYKKCLFVNRVKV